MARIQMFFSVGANHVDRDYLGCLSKTASRNVGVSPISGFRRVLLALDSVGKDFEQKNPRGQTATVEAAYNENHINIMSDRCFCLENGYILDCPPFPVMVTTSIIT